MILTLYPQLLLISINFSLRALEAQRTYGLYVNTFCLQPIDFTNWGGHQRTFIQ